MPLEIDVLYEFDEAKIRREYVGKKPYVLKGIGTEWPAMKWNFKSIKDLCGSTKITAIRYDRNSSLSYLVQSAINRRRMTVSTFLDSYFLKGKNAATWSIKECEEVFIDKPHLLEDVMFQSVYAGPSDIPCMTFFWIGNPNSSIGLHADICDFSNLFQIMGTKKWKFYPPHDKENLYMETKNTIEGGLYSPLDPFNPIDSTKYPNYAKASEYEVTIGPGDILYVPSGWWHAVYSETATMSVNYICADDGHESWFSNFPAMMEAARILTIYFMKQLYTFITFLFCTRPAAVRESNQKKASS